MKSLFTILALFSFVTSNYSQNKICTYGTLSIYLNTEEIVYHQINTPYYPVKPTVVSTICDSNTLSLTHTTNVNENKLGLYNDDYFGKDSCSDPVRCYRWVRVVDTTSAKVVAIKYQDISVYPNPIEDFQFTVELLSTYNSENMVIQLFEANGREVFKMVYPASGKSRFIVSLKDQGIENGIYVLTVSQGASSLKRKVAIQ